MQRYLDGSAPAPPPASAPPRRPRPRLALLAALGAGLVLVAGVLVAAPPPVRPAPTSAPPRLEDVGDGQTMQVASDAVVSSRRVAVAVQGQAVAGREFEGRGDAVVAVVAPSTDGGRVLVSATSNGLSPIAWRALLTVTRADWTSYRVVLARGLSAAQPDVPAASTFLYAHRGPTQVAVSAPADVRWTLRVGVAGGLEPALR